MLSDRLPGIWQSAELSAAATPAAWLFVLISLVAHCGTADAPGMVSQNRGRNVENRHHRDERGDHAGTPLSSEPTPFPLFTVLGKSLTLKGYLYVEIVNDDAALDRAKSFITKGLASGQLKPVIARVFRLDQIQEATRFLESNAQVGKIVVNV